MPSEFTGESPHSFKPVLVSTMRDWRASSEFTACPPLPHGTLCQNQTFWTGLHATLIIAKEASGSDSCKSPWARHWREGIGGVNGQATPRKAFIRPAQGRAGPIPFQSMNGCWLEREASRMLLASSSLYSETNYFIYFHLSIYFKEILVLWSSLTAWFIAK